MRGFCLCLFFVICNKAFAQQVKLPIPDGPVPSERQIQWHELEMYGFVHFTMNTFTGKEWGVC
ncbi:hypothetical protein EDF66_10376 [Sphingobacterium sp. JUb20]|nr:hypothetical protein [Sphingobacterium sp. JUb21]TCR08529.1 hypothetical protein EDF66_10376 [Sphingobacterium sp. JUb20]